jgi:hypothetical protein
MLDAVVESVADSVDAKMTLALTPASLRKK